MKTKSNSFLRLSAITVAITLAALPSARAANATWSTTPTNVDWNVAGNWDVLPTTGTSLVFGNSTQTTLNNDLTSDSFNIAGITFNVGSPAYTISGNAFALTGGITNSSSNLQTINDAFSMTAARTFTTVGGITLGGNVTGTGGGITKAGAGTLSLTGISNAWTGNTTVNAGTLNLNGGFGGTIGSSSSIFGVGLNNGVNGATTAVGTVATGAVANIGGGTYTLSQLSVGYTNFNMAGSGWLTMTNGTITATNSTGYFVIGGEDQKPGNGQLGIGQVDLSGNSTINFNYTSTSAGDVEVGVRGGRGVLNIGGNAALNANKLVLAATWTGGEDANTRVYVNQSGGTVTLSNAAGLSYNGSTSGRVAVYNLTGGILNTQVITAPTGQTGASAVFNFNGGTLTAGAANANFMSNLSGAIVYAGGATINDGGNAITIGQALKAPTGYGLGAVGTTLTPSAAGTGYVNPPNVTFNSPSVGLPATGYAELNANGTIKDIVITSPGSGYTSGQAVTVTLQGGGGGSGATFTSVTASTASSGGGLTKTGTSTLTLSGANTYTGATIVTGGLISLNVAEATGTGPLGNPSTLTNSIVLQGGGLQFTSNNTNDYTPSGRLQLADSSTGTIDTNGQNVTFANAIGVGPLTTGSLTKSGIGKLTLSGANSYTGLTTVSGGTLAYGANDTISTGAVTVNGAGAVLAMGAFNDTVGTVTLTAGDITGSGTLTSSSGFTMNNEGATSVSAILGGAVALTKTGNGTLTLSGANTYSGGTAVNTGTLTFLNTTAQPSSGIVTVAAGATLGLGVSGSNAFTSANIDSLFAGTLANVTNNATSNVGIDTTNGNFTYSSSVASTTRGLVKLGANTLTLSGANAYAGLTTVSGGTLAYGANDTISTGAVTVNGAGAVLAMGAFNDSVGAVTLTAGTITGTGTLTSTSGFTMNNAGATSVSANLAGAVALTKSGAGTLSLTGSNNAWTGNTTVNAGTLNLNGGFGGTIGSSLSVLGVGYANGLAGAVLNIGGGTFNAHELKVGYASTTTAGTGWLTMTSGTITMTSATWFAIGGEDSQPGNGLLGAGQVDLSGNSVINMNSGLATPGTLLGVRGGKGVLNISGTAALNTNTIFVGNTFGAGDDSNIRAYLTQSGGTVTLSDATNGLTYQGTTASQSVYNLNGGVLNTKVIKAAGASASNEIFNFNGGTLTAGAASSTFMTGLSAAIVYAGGANIDDGGKLITISQALKAPTGYGLGAVGTTLTPTAAGTGYVNPPNVTFNTPSGGLPATGYATINATTGQVTGIVITSPGSGYGNGEAVTVTLQGGGGGSGATFTSVTAATASSGGGLTKTGTGTLTLSGANTYTGATTINTGTLALGVNSALAATTAVSIGSATLDAATFTDTVGTLNATGSAVIHLGSGAALAFADSHSITWAGTLNLTGTFVSGSSIKFGSSSTALSSTQLNAIRVNGSGAGTYTLDSSGYLIISSGPGPVTHFVISAIGSPQTVGTPITGITLTAQDAANATATGFTGTVTFGGTGGFSGTSAAFTAGVLTGVITTPTVSGSNLTLTVADGSSHTGSATITTIRTQYDAWASGAVFNVDANNDSVSNGLAWLLGAANPSANATGKLPVASQSSGNLVMSFDCLSTTDRGAAALNLQYSNDLGTSDSWTSHQAQVPGVVGSSDVGNVHYEATANGSLIHIVATVSSTQSASGKLFGRLEAQP